MSLNLKGISCVRCRSYLFAEDDVVYCPVCGAPHHRECYNALGHCALEEFHGTENEYSRKAEEEKVGESQVQIEVSKPSTVKCRMCGEEYDVTLNRCPKCNAPDLSKIRGFEGFDFLGGVPADTDLGEGVTAEEAKNFVASNTHRYIPKFLNFKNKKKVSWNWAGFLFPAGWLLSRKMYKNGIIAAILSITATIMSYPFVETMYDLGFITNGQIAPNAIELTNELPPNIWIIVLLSLLGSALMLGIRLVFGLFGDYFYRNYSIKTIKKIKTDSADINTDYRKKGGSNLLLFFLGVMLVQYGTQIILLLV